MKSIFIFLFATILTCNLFADTTTVAADFDRNNHSLLVSHTADIDSNAYVVSDHFSIDEFTADSINGNYTVLISGTGERIVTVIEGTNDQVNHVMLDSVIAFSAGATETLQTGSLVLTGVKYKYYRIKSYAYDTGSIKQEYYFAKPDPIEN
jgi:hypothetical protein